MGYPTQQQKVDYLFKKIGFTKTKTGVAEDQTSGFSGDTKKAPPNEAIASPLIVPGSTIWSDSSLIPATPPTSSTAHVGIYTAGNAFRMSVDTTVSNNRTFIARETWWNPSSAIQGDWIDTQFGADYLVKVYMGDPSTGVPGVAYTNLSAAGTAGKDDVWFFDYSSGVLNFNGEDLDGQLTGITTSNVYIVGYRYTGGKGAQPTAGVGTFSSLYVSGISTFAGDVYFDGETAGRDVVWDRSDNALKFKDNTRAMFGDNGDLSVYHYNVGGTVRTTITNQFGAGEFHVIHNGTLPFKIQQGPDDAIVVRPQVGAGSTSVELYCDNNLRLATTNTGINITDNLNVAGISTFSGRIIGIQTNNVIPFYYANVSDFPSASTYHGAFAHAHNTGRAYFAHAGWKELVNREVNGVVGTGTERYNIGPVDATSLKVTGITTLGNIGVSTGLISGPAITYIDPATVGDNAGTLVVKGNLQVEGTQTTVNSSTMTVTDKNIELAKGAANDAAADGGGITIDSGGGDKTWQWLDATDSWTSSEHIRLATGKVYGFSADTNTFIANYQADSIEMTTGGVQRFELKATNSGNSTVLTISDDGNHGDVYGGTGVVVHGSSGARIKFAQSSLGYGIAAGFEVGAYDGGAYLINREPQDIFFSIAPNHSSNPSELVRIKSTGQVSIGTTNNTGSNTKLVVGTGSTTADAVAVINTNDQDVDVIRLSNFDGATTSNKLEVHFDSSGHAGFDVGIPAATPVFEIRNTSGGGGRFRLKNDGKLLINTTTEGVASADDLTIATSGSTGITLRSDAGYAGNVAFSDGTSGADEYRGLIQYHHLDNSMRFSTNAVEKLRIDTDGNTNIVGVVTAQYLKVSYGSDANKQNVKIGWMQSENLSTGNYNVLVGRRAGEDVDTGGSLVLIGANAGQKLTNQTASVIIGAAAGNNATGDNNVYIGKNTAQQSTSAERNVIVGTYAGIDNQGNGNTLIGYYSGRGVSGATDGTENTFIGHKVGFAIRGGDSNTGLGYDALVSLQNGNYNTALGDRAGEALLNGSSNVFIGKNTGKLVTSGSNDIVIGSGAQASSATVSNEITLGNNSITKFRIPGIGVTMTGDIMSIPTPVIDVDGDVTVQGNFKVVGVSTFSDDVTFTTANSKNIVFDKSANDLTFGDGVLARFGDSNDLSLYHDSSSSNIVDAYGALNIKSNVLTLRASDNSRYIEALNASHVKLYYAGNEKLATSGIGVTVTGETKTTTLNVTGITTTGTLNTGDTTFTGTISAGSTTGTDGYYLKSTGIGVTWAVLPSSRTTSTQTATAGQTSFNFSYNIGFVDVFLNGVKLPSSEFTANNGSTIVLDDAAFANDTLEFISLNTVPVTSGGGATNLDGLSDVNITSAKYGQTLRYNGVKFVNDFHPHATTTSTSQVSITNLDITEYRSAEYLIQVTEGTKYHVTKIIAIHDGTNVTFNEYGTITTSTPLATFSVDINSGIMRLLATPASTNSTSFKVKFDAIAV